MDNSGRKNQRIRLVEPDTAGRIVEVCFGPALRFILQKPIHNYLVASIVLNTEDLMSKIETIFVFERYGGGNPECEPEVVNRARDEKILKPILKGLLF